MNRRLGSHRGTVLLLTLALSLIASVPALALAVPVSASDPPARISISAIDVTKFPNVEATAVVVNAAGVPVTGLDKTMFVLAEDGKTVPVGAVDAVASNTASVAVVLALDASGSLTGRPLSEAVSAMAGFVDRLTPTDQVGAVAGGANCVVNPGPGLGADTVDVKEFLRGVRAAGYTPLYGTALAAVQMAVTAPEGRRMVVVLTDGEDRCGSVTADTLVAVATRNNVPLYFIGLGPNVRPGALQSLAAATGGQYLAAADTSRLAVIYDGIATRLRTQYVVRYQSALLADRKEHTLTVQVRTDTETASAEQRFTPPVVQPDVKLSIPQNQQIARRTTVEVSTTRPVKLVRADVYLDGASIYTATQTSPATQASLSFPLDPAGVSRGAHTLRVRVTDATGGEAEASQPIQFVSGGALGALPSWLLPGVVLVLAVAAAPAVFLATRRRRRRCAACGREMEAGWAVCPYCRAGVRQELVAAPAATGFGRADPTHAPAAFASEHAEEVPYASPTDYDQGPLSESSDQMATGAARRAAPTALIETPSTSYAWLVVASGSQRGTRFRLGSNHTSIGRDATSDVVVDDDGASRQHARISRAGDRYEVIDLDTTNGTFVNGRRVGRHALRQGDQITIGATTLAFMPVLGEAPMPGMG